MPHSYFVSGIGTEIGKTVISSILVEALEADYWKPIQSGDLDYSDSMKIRAYISNSKTVIHPEGFRLKTPMSPHAAADIDDIHIGLEDFKLPVTENHLIVEGAGGLLVPINHQQTLIELIQQLGLEVILVSRHYLGSINHTLLSIEALKSRNIPIKGIIFNGNEHPTTEGIIQELADIPVLFRLPELPAINQKEITQFAKKLSAELLEKIG